MIKLDNKLINDSYEINNHLIVIRIEPPKFREALKKFNNLLSSKRYKEASELYENLPLEWKNDQEFIRGNTLLQFLTEE